VEFTTEPRVMSRNTFAAFWVSITRKPPVEAALVVTYVHFPIQVCFPCSASPSPTLLPSPTAFDC